MWRRVAIAVVLVWTLVVANWASRSWSDSVTLTTPPGVEEQSREFVCSTPFDANAAQPKDSNASEYGLSRQPCEVHGERRWLAMFDIGLGLAGVALLIWLGARSSSRKKAAAPALTG